MVKIAIVGAGISGLATAQAILSRSPGAEVVVYEASQRVGGKVWTESGPGGFLCEGGVNGFLDKIPRTLQLCDDVGLSPLAANSAAEKRYVFSQQALHRLPATPVEFMTSRLLSIPGRLRVLGEILAPASDQADESLAEFARRRLGREAFEKLIDPMASGVFAGDPASMSLKSCFPRIHEVETEFGSLIRGLVKLQIKARAEGSKNTLGPGPGGRLTSFQRGMSSLTDALVAQLGPRLRTTAPVASISRQGRVYTVHLADGRDEQAERLILAVPAYAQSDILRECDPQLAQLTGAIDYPPLAVVCLGYQEIHHLQSLDGFGFLVPSRERRSILGTLVDSNVFPGRAPEGHMLLRTMVGGARSPRLAELPNDQLLDRVRSDLRDITGLATEPVFSRIFRHEKAIPQYAVGHAARLDAIDQAVLRHPGLVLTGNAFRGVSLNDCVLNAWKTAESLVP
ncbi:MAG TPA: protoporphyrinogen oxidase [Xanthomonadales bacterium]|nr:protoporphyrinogen oxidase [Xanthomonadales bacterium]